MKILVNAVQCRVCNKILHSKSVHDFVSCDHIFTDGGNEYIRRGGNPKDMIDLTAYECENRDDAPLN